MDWWLIRMTRLGSPKLRPLKSHRRLVIAFVGLDFEARIAAAPGVQVVCRTAGKELEESLIQPSGKAIAV